MTAEVFFYHLQRRTLEDVLPDLLERTLGRDWRAIVKASSPERVEALNAHLWSYRRDAFLPHGSARDGEGPCQPIWLTDGDDNPNRAAVLFLVDGAEAEAERIGDFDRVCDIFDGNDDAAVAAARDRWRRVKAAGLQPVYWKQTPAGGWEKQG